MTLLARIFLENILPIFLAAGVGFVLGRRLRPDLKTVSRLTVYIFSPCYGLIAAGVVRFIRWERPLTFARPIGLLGEAAIPEMRVLLGLQMAETRAWPRARLRLIGLASFLQRVVARSSGREAWPHRRGPAGRAAGGRHAHRRHHHYSRHGV